MLPIKDNNPTTITPWVTYAIIAINVVVFLGTVTLDPRAAILVNLQYGAIRRENNKRRLVRTALQTDRHLAPRQSGYLAPGPAAITKLTGRKKIYEPTTIQIRPTPGLRRAFRAMP